MIVLSRRPRGQQGLAVLKETCFWPFLVKREEGRDRIVLNRGNRIAPLSTSLISHLPGLCEYILNVSLRCKHSATVTHNLVILKGNGRMLKQLEHEMDECEES